MAQPRAQLRQAGTGSKINPLRIVARYHRGGKTVTDSRDDDPGSGTRKFSGGDFERAIRREDYKTAATVRGTLRNRSVRPIYVESVEFGLVFEGHRHQDLRFLRHGWQSGSPTGVRSLTSSSESDFPSGPCLVESRAGRDMWLGAVNFADEVSHRPFPADSLFRSAGDSSNGPDPATSSEEIGSETRAVELDAHGSAIVRAPKSRKPAVFCDFDGTFSTRDVGASLAQKFLPELRSGLQRRYERGELGAWDYQLELFEGFAFSSSKLDAFLVDIELDPGASSLVAWCEDQGIPFRILSDGFDYNLERLQAIHGVVFPYSANHLVFEDDCWRISPGGPNPDCGCETGTCKRAIIEAFRRNHPGAYCVHIGDGRVSDLCGAEAADLVFAKGTLGEALRTRGIQYQPFEDLHSVRRHLAQHLA